MKELARSCDFGVTTEGVNLMPQLVLEESLCDRFVCGLGESRIQRQLLSETKLTYKSAVDVANAMELADEGPSHISRGKATSQVNQLFNSDRKKKSTQPNSTTKTKKRVIGAWVTINMKSVRDAECYICKKKGHIAKTCKATGDKTNPGTKPEQKKATVYELYNMNTPAMGDLFVAHNELLMIMKHHHKRPVSLCSTLHKGIMKDTARLDRDTDDLIQKPDAIINFNKYMGAIDLSDQ